MPGPAHPCRLVVFDLDGTLIDSQHLIVESMTRAFRAAGLEDPEPAKVLAVIGLALEEAVARVLDTHGVESDQPVARFYREAFFALRGDPEYHEPLYPGAREVLAELTANGLLLAIATGKGRRGLIATLERHGLGDHFMILKSADDGPSKPHPEILCQAMAEAGVAARETAVVGDTVFDMAMARAAGATGIGVAWGYHPPARLSAGGAEVVIERFSDLVPTLARLFAA